MLCRKFGPIYACHMMAPEMLTRIDGAQLAEAFPQPIRSIAVASGERFTCRFSSEQWTDRITLQVDGQSVCIPWRWNYSFFDFPLSKDDAAWRICRALQTRCPDGFERQRAARDLLANFQSWASPFIVMLIGEYIVEILEDIDAALTAQSEQMIAAFIDENTAFWETTKRRVTSYWNAYYRGRGSECRDTYVRTDYVGFKLVDRLDKVVFELNKITPQPAPPRN